MGGKTIKSGYIIQYLDKKIWNGYIWNICIYDGKQINRREEQIYLIKYLKYLGGKQYKMVIPRGGEQ